MGGLFTGLSVMLSPAAFESGVTSVGETAGTGVAPGLGVDMGVDLASGTAVGVGVGKTLVTGPVGPTGVEVSVGVFPAHAEKAKDAASSTTRQARFIFASYPQFQGSPHHLACTQNAVSRTSQDFPCHLGVKAGKASSPFGPMVTALPPGG